MSINTSNLSDIEEIDRFEQAVQTFFNGHIDADRFTAVRLQQGVYGQRQEGVNMLRTKVPGAGSRPRNWTRWRTWRGLIRSAASRMSPRASRSRSISCHWQNRPKRCADWRKTG